MQRGAAQPQGIPIQHAIAMASEQHGHMLFVGPEGIIPIGRGKHQQGARGVRHARLPCTDAFSQLREWTKQHCFACNTDIS